MVHSHRSRTFLKRLKLAKRGALTTAAVLATTALLLSSPVAAPVAAAGAADEVASGVFTRVLARWAAGPVGELAAGVFAWAFARRGWLCVGSVIGSACALGLGAAAHKLEGCFYGNFERHPALG